MHFLSSLQHFEIFPHFDQSHPFSNLTAIVNENRCPKYSPATDLCLTILFSMLKLTNMVKCVSQEMQNENLINNLRIGIINEFPLTNEEKSVIFLYSNQNLFYVYLYIHFISVTAFDSVFTNIIPEKIASSGFSWALLCSTCISGNETIKKKFVCVRLWRLLLPLCSQTFHSKQPQFTHRMKPRKKKINKK